MNSKNTNILFITLDSCRWDSYLNANTPTLDLLAKFKKAYTQGTYTLPAHISFFSGILPSTLDYTPLYDRFNQDLFRINYRNANTNALFTFPNNANNIIDGFNQKGYKTIGVGAVSWFKHKLLNSYFNKFKFTGIHLDVQIEFVIKEIINSNKPFFAFINIGETHEPYEFGSKIDEVLVSRARMRASKNIGYLKREHEKQILAIKYIDNKLNFLFKSIKELGKETIVIICGDHGECFGEDGYYGHGFYHPKIIEVPLGIFQI